MNKQVEIKDVDFSSFTIKRKEVKINDKLLPLAIGDKLKFTDTDTYSRTVMGITINEDGRVQYIVEWFDPNTNNFASEAFTISELKLLNTNQFSISKNKATRKQIGF